MPVRKGGWGGRALKWAFSWRSINCSTDFNFWLLGVADCLKYPAVLLFAAIAAIMAACAPVSKLPEISKEAAKIERDKQLELAALQFYGNTQRVHAIAYKILKVNAELCEDNVRKGSGIFPVNKYFFKKDYRPLLKKALGIADEIKVLGVAPGSSGERAGVREGDFLTSLNGWTIPEGEDAMAKLSEKFKEISKTDNELLLTSKRGEKYQTVSFRPETVCKYGYAAAEGGSVNAFADGERIMIEGGMMRFVESDTELATVISHEIAHNMMDHIPKKIGNQAIGLVFDILFAGLGVNTQGLFGKIGGQAFSQEFESEADYVGLYLMARAGYEIDKSPYLWRRMALNHPGNIKTNLLATHPATPHRFLGLENTVKEIMAKKAAGVPLVPDKKEPSKVKPEG